MLKQIALMGFSLLFMVRLQAAQAPQIAVASSLQFAMPELVLAFEQQTGVTPRITYGSSGNFSRQIIQGAPFEVFLSADESYVEVLTDKNLSDGNGRVYALGRMAIVVPRNHSEQLSVGLEFVKQAIEGKTLSRFAIANPDHAPYGRAAREVLKSTGLWQSIQPYLVKGENASQAMQFALSGSSQGGLLPLALTKSPSITNAAQILELPATLHKPIQQRMVLLKHASEAAKAFYVYMGSDTAKAIFSRYGYQIPSGKLD